MRESATAVWNERSTMNEKTVLGGGEFWAMAGWAKRGDAIKGEEWRERVKFL